MSASETGQETEGTDHFEKSPCNIWRENPGSPPKDFPAFPLRFGAFFYFFTASASLEPRALRAPAAPTSPCLAATGRVRSTARNISSANAHAASTQRSRARPARGETVHLSKTFSGY